MESYVIEKGIPIPKARANTFTGLIRSMSVGDSVVVDASKGLTLSNAAKAVGVKLKSRTLGDGMRRVWRVA